MDIVIFILFILLLVVPKPIIWHMARAGHRAAAIILAIGLVFIQPFALMWYAKFLYAYTLTYWAAFGTIIVIDILTYSYEGDK
jgi:hypothetical protein